MRIDEQFMKEVGLDKMPAAEKQAFMEHAEEELEVRVGQSIGAYLSAAQMDEFENIDDMQAAASWLEKNVPNFREVVKTVYDGFKRELIAERDSILG